MSLAEQIILNIKTIVTGQAQVNQLTDSTNRLGDAANRLDGAYRDANGRLRDAQGRFIATGQAAQGAGASIAGAGAAATGAAGRFGGLNLSLMGLQSGLAIVQQVAQSVQAVTSQMKEWADSANQAATDTKVFELTLRRFAVNTDEAGGAAERLAQKFGLSVQDVQGSMTTLIRAGFRDMGQLEKVMEGAAASSIAFGRDAKAGFENVADAAVTGLSAALNGIGISENLGPAMDKFAKSVGKTADALNEQERAQVLANLVMKATGTEVEALGEIQNDYVRSQQEADLAQKQFSRNMGELTMPLVVRFNRTLADVTGTVADVVGALQSGKDPLDALALRFPQLSGALQRLRPIFDALRGGLTEFGQAGERNLGKLEPVIERLRPRFEQAGAAIGPMLERLGEVMRHLGQLAQQAFERVIIPVIEKVGPIIAQVIQRAAPLIASLGEAFQEAARLILAAWEHIVLPLLEKIAPIVQAAVDHVAKVLGPLVEAVKKVFQAVRQAIEGDWAGAWDSAKKALGNALLGVQKLLDGLADLVWKALVAAADLIDKKADELWGRFLTFGESAAAQFVAGFKNIEAGIRDAVANALEGAISKIPPKVRDWLAGKGLDLNAPLRALRESADDLRDEAQATRDAGSDAPDKPLPVSLSGDKQNEAFFRAIFGQETGGLKAPYTTVNSIGALGKYQVMAQHLLFDDSEYRSSRNTGAWFSANRGNRGQAGHGWDYAALGKDITPDEYLKNPQYQELIAQYQMGANLQRRLNEANGNLEVAIKEAAKDWYGRGKPLAGHPTPDQYAASVWARFQKEARAGAGALPAAVGARTFSEDRFSLRSAPNTPAIKVSSKVVASEWGASFIGSLKDVFVTDPGIDSDCAIIAARVLGRLGVHLEGAVNERINAGKLVQQFIDHGGRKVGGEKEQAQAASGDLVHFRGNGFGAKGSGNHVGVVVGVTPEGKALVIQNPGSGPTEIVTLDSVLAEQRRKGNTAQATIYRAPESPFAQGKSGQPGAAAATAETESYTKATNALINRLQAAQEAFSKVKVDSAGYAAALKTFRTELTAVNAEAQKGFTGAGSKAERDAYKGIALRAKGSLAEINKGTAQASVTDAQIAEAMRLKDALEKAQAAAQKSPKSIPLAQAVAAAKRELDEFTKKGPAYAEALAAIQSGSTKASKGYIASAQDLKKYGTDALKIIRDLEAAQNSGDATAIAAVETRKAAWIGESKARQSVFDIESRAYAVQKQGQEALTALTRQQAQQRQADRVTAARRTLDLAQQDQQDQLSVAGLTEGRKLDIIKATQPKILAANRALNAALRNQAGQEADALAQQQLKDGKLSASVIEQTRRAAWQRAYREEAQANADAQRGILRTSQQAQQQLAQAQRELQAKMADERRQLSVQEANDELSRVRTYNAQELLLFKGTAQQRLGIVRQQAQDEYNAQMQVARALKAQAEAALKNDLTLSDDVRQRKQAAIDRAFQLAQTEATNAKTNALRQATQGLEEEKATVTGLIGKYNDLRRALLARGDTGSLTAEDMTKYAADLAGLWAQAKKAGLTALPEIQKAHSAAKAFADTAIDHNAAAIERTAGQYADVSDAVTRAAQAQGKLLLSTEDVLVRLPDAESEWDAYVAVMEELDGKGHLAAGALAALRQQISDTRAQADKDLKTYAATLQTTIDNIQNESEAGLLRLYNQANATRDQQLMDAVYAEWERRRSQQEQQDAAYLDWLESQGIDARQTLEWEGQDNSPDAPSGAVTAAEGAAAQRETAAGLLDTFTQLDQAALSNADTLQFWADTVKGAAESGGVTEAQASALTSALDLLGKATDLLPEDFATFQAALRDAMSDGKLTGQELADLGDQLRLFGEIAQQSAADFEEFREVTDGPPVKAGQEAQKLADMQAANFDSYWQGIMDVGEWSDEMTAAWDGILKNAEEKGLVSASQLEKLRALYAQFKPALSALDTELQSDLDKVLEQTVGLDSSAEGYADTIKTKLLPELERIRDYATDPALKAQAEAAIAALNGEVDAARQLADLRGQMKLDQLDRDRADGKVGDRDFIDQREGLLLSQEEERFRLESEGKTGAALELLRAQHEKRLTEIRRQGADDRRALALTEADTEIAQARRLYERSYGLDGQPQLVSALQGKRQTVEGQLFDLGPNAAGTQAYIALQQQLLDLDDQIADARGLPHMVGTWQAAITRLGEDFAAQKITAKQFTDELHKLAPRLLEMAAAAEKAGDAKSAQAFRDLAQSLKAMDPATAAALVKLGKLQKAVDAFAQVAGALSKFASAMGEAEEEYDSVTGEKLSTPWKDAAANIDGAVNAVQTFMGIAADIASGNWVGAITKVISSIADAVAGYQKANAEVRRLRQEFVADNPLLAADDYQKVYTRSRGFFADLFGGGPEVVNEIDKVGLKIAQSFASATSDGLRSGIEQAVETGDTSAIQKSLYGGIKKAALGALIDSFMNSAAVLAVIQPLMKKLSDAFKSGDREQIRAALAEYKAGIASLKPELDAVVEAGQEIGAMFGEDPFTKLKNSLHDAVKGGIESGAKSALKSAIQKGDMAGLEQALRESVGESVMDALIDTFMKSAAMQAIIGPAMEQLAAAIATPETTDDDAAWATFDRSLSRYAAALSEFGTRTHSVLGRNGLLETAPNVRRTKEQNEQDAALQRYLTDGDPSNDEAALRAYRERNGGARGSSLTYTIGSSGMLSDGSAGGIVGALQGLAQTAQVMAQAGRDQLRAAGDMLQAARMQLQAAGESYAGNYETGRMTFNNGGI